MKVELPYNYSQNEAFNAVPKLAHAVCKLEYTQRCNIAFEIYKELYSIGEMNKEDYANGLWNLIDEMSGIKRK